MGIDVSLYATGRVTDEQLAEANAFLQARGVEGGLRGESPLQRHGDRVEWHWSPRCYGPGYERGHWPDIYNAILCLRAALPQCVVHYGSDLADHEEDGGVPEVTDERLRDLWAHWLSPDGVAYHDRRVAIFGA